MSRMKFPKQVWEGLNSIAKMDKADFDQLLEVLARAKPSLSSADLVNGSENRLITEFLLSVYYEKEVGGLSIESAVEALLGEGRKIGIVISDEGRASGDSIKDRLRKALSLEGALPIGAKARDVLTENERFYLDSRIITEMRPVYGDPSSKPQAAVILHTLKIVAYESFRNAEFFVTLDNRDLKQLRADIDRAIKKTGGLKSAIEEMEMHYLEVDEEA